MSSSSPIRRSARTPTCRTASIRAATLARVRAVPGVALAAGEVFSLATLFDAARQAPEHARAELRRLDAAGALRELLDGARGAAAHAPATSRSTRRRRSATRSRVGAACCASPARPRPRATASPGSSSSPGSASFGGAGVALLTLAAGAARRRRARRLRHDRGRRDAGHLRRRRCARGSARCCRATLDVRTGTQEAAQQTSDLESQLGFLRTFLLIFAYVALFVGAFIIFNTFSITVAQRTREFGLLRTLGATRGQLAALGRRRGRDARPRRRGDRPRRRPRRSRRRSTSSSRRSAPTCPTAARSSSCARSGCRCWPARRSRSLAGPAAGDPRLARHADRGAARGRLAARADAAQPAPRG